jgi:hypothetical protein
MGVWHSPSRRHLKAINLLHLHHLRKQLGGQRTQAAASRPAWWVTWSDVSNDPGGIWSVPLVHNEAEWYLPRLQLLLFVFHRDGGRRSVLGFSESGWACSTCGDGGRRGAADFWRAAISPRQAAARVAIDGRVVLTVSAPSLSFSSSSSLWSSPSCLPSTGHESAIDSGRGTAPLGAWSGRRQGCGQEEVRIRTSVRDRMCISCSVPFN